MFKFFLFFSVSILSQPSLAIWVEHAVVTEVDTTEPRLLTNALLQFPDALNFLSAENLTAPSRVKVKQLVGRIAEYRWENDSQCAVADPGAVVPVRMSTAKVDFFYEHRPGVVLDFEVQAAEPDPCSRASAKKQKP